MTLERPKKTREKMAKMAAAALAAGVASTELPKSADAAIYSQQPVVESVVGAPTKWTPEYVQGYYRRLAEKKFDASKLEDQQDRQFHEVNMRRFMQEYFDHKSELDKIQDEERLEARKLKEHMLFHAGHRAYLMNMLKNGEEFTKRLVDAPGKPAEIAAQEQALESRAYGLLLQIYPLQNRFSAQYPDFDTLVRDVVASTNVADLAQLKSLNRLYVQFENICRTGGHAGEPDGLLTCDRALTRKLLDEKNMMQENRQAPQQHRQG